METTTVKGEYVPRPRPAHEPPLLLAFLTQTARYCSEIVSRVGGKPTLTAELFAGATRKLLKEVSETASLERTQALLFLGFYEWTALHGQKGFQTIRAAITSAQALGYQYLDHPENTNNKAGTESCGDEYAQQDIFIEREIERRTFWSCFIMDRYMSCGKLRPPVLDVTETWVQLPCSDEAFGHGQNVKTRILAESDEEYLRRRQVSESFLHPIDRAVNDISGVDNEVEWEVGKDEGELSLYIRRVEHFGRVMKWSTKGGRR